MLSIAILFGKLSCLAHLQEPDSIYPNLAKRQTDQSPASSSGSTGPQHSVLEQYKKRKWSTSSLPETDQKALKAAETFLNDDHISLQQAMKKHMTEREPKLFTNEVLHRSKGHVRPVGYESVKQVVARHAETLLRAGKHSEEEARKLGQARIDRKNDRRQDRMWYWKNMADTDPSQARHEKENVPYRIAKHRYVALRSHQLEQRGKAENMHAAKKMATEEIDKVLARKRESERNRLAKLRQKGPK
ncbi:uncharacterized protein FA14DRAFT_177783 [Meira miltonrushii]|uniref:MRPL25 domain-containing protein n=1 Tax=Meira miltonrushii TaxID=1280837 RepID=A0A316VMK6_9BASI|nr:uncharacterized protein FA14DRAFT_177783 [Meira miltonrushii]PWN38514.1 hypothetical protein FA14DRAFT_177783 [Meira miltonrushii]